PRDGGCHARHPTTLGRTSLMYIMGLDLGQAKDYSACIVLYQKDIPGLGPVYAVVLAHRWPLGTPYPAIRATLVAHLAPPEMRGHALCVDYTGCGRPVVDELRRVGLTCTAVTIHGGAAESHEGGNWSVPKRDLVGVTLWLLQAERLKFAEGVPLLPEVQE